MTNTRNYWISFSEKIMKKSHLNRNFHLYSLLNRIYEEIRIQKNLFKFIYSRNISRCELKKQNITEKQEIFHKIYLNRFLVS